MRGSLAVVLALVGAWAAVRGIRLFARGLRRADEASASLWVVRGIRGIVVGVGTGALASGVLFGQLWLLVFGAIFLAEELYETGVLALILRRGRRASEGEKSRAEMKLRESFQGRPPCRPWKSTPSNSSPNG